MNEILPESFFHQPTLELAKALLGCRLVKHTYQGITSGFIVETEAYKGPEDQAAHSYQNKRTNRTEVMFGKPGRAYTHRMHTHCLINVVSGEIETPHSVLIRAVEPAEGIELMYERRGQMPAKNLTNGPGKLTKALGISMEDYALPLFEPPIYIAKGYNPENISTGPRIGIDNSGEAKDYPYRFWITDNPYVSRKR